MIMAKASRNFLEAFFIDISYIIYYCTHRHITQKEQDMSKNKETSELKGVCHFYAEEGSEGGLWAFQDKNFIEKPSTKFPRGEWSYDGLRILSSGDHLTVFDPEHANLIIWQGIVSLEIYPLFTETVDDVWIHSEQIGTPRKVWAKWFFDQYPAILVKGPKIKLTQ